MDDTREESKFTESNGLNQGYGSSEMPKVSVNNVSYTQSRTVDKYVDEDDDDEVEVEEDENGEQEQEETNVGDGDMNDSALQNGNDGVDNVNQYGDEDDENGEDHNGRESIVSVNMQRHPKKRKLKSLLLNYELAPRVPPPTSTRKRSFGGRNTLRDWSEQETFVLLEAWGDQFLQCGRKSLRSEEWQEVADRVSQVSKIERTDSQCRNRLDTLKKKYKKEMANLKGGGHLDTKWVYFKKMDMLLSLNLNPVKHNTNLNSANGPIDARVGSVKSDSLEGEHDDDDDDDGSDSDLLPPKKSEPGGSFKMLADSINKFSEIYEKIEKSKIQQMIELEKMRMDFLKDLELQKRQILDRAQAEMTKVQQGDYEDNDVSAENVSG
uniref:trihelix transcription factor ASIL2-like n=1 Tax=Erigeron canadensis TaxID=72917 RepID=UPI001CB992FE|nr:trihelix transcription factor ASIL2-like [Erigeron canadensis]